jgi:hypothetical protein
MEELIKGFSKAKAVIELAKLHTVSITISLALTAIVTVMIISSLTVDYSDLVTDSENELIARHYLESLPVNLAQGEVEKKPDEESNKLKAGKKIAGFFIGDDLVNKAESAILEVHKTHFKIRLFDYGKDDGDSVTLSSGVDTVDVRLSKDVTENKIDIKDGHFTIEAKRDSDKNGVTVAVMAQNKDGEKPVFLPVMKQGQRFVVEIKQ